MSASKPVLLLGVGGMGMAPLALLLAQQGVSVVGNDAMLTPQMRALLEAHGVRIEDCLLEEQLSDYAEVVHSSALSRQHPLIVAARAQGLSVRRRGERLAELLANKKIVAVAGSHGKTTTTALLVHAMHSAGLNPTFAIGGLPADGSAPASWSDSEWAVVELDESDGTMETFHPHATLLLNADWDHADQYPDTAAMMSAFGRLLTRTRGPVVVGPGLRECFADELSGQSCYTLDDFNLGGVKDLPEAAFNRQNALHAAALMQALAITVPADAFAGFAGVTRRQRVLYEDAQTVVLEDYAHHPSEMRVLLEALKQSYAGYAIQLIFQPHRFSRTACLAEGFANVLRGLDSVWLLPVYAAHEPYQEKGTSQAIADLLPGKARLLGLDQAALVELRATGAQAEKCLYAFVGAGDIGEFAEWFCAYLAADGKADQAYLAWCRGHLTKDTMVKENEPLATKTTLRVGGRARWYAEPARPSDLRFLLRAARYAQLPVFFLGRGSNLIVSDDGFPGWVIRLNHHFWRRVERLPDGKVYAGAGVRLKELCGFAAKSGLSGFEFMEGIPGAVGGSLRMNAGAMGSWLFDRVESVLMMTLDGAFRRLPVAAFHVDYRRVDELVDAVALGAIFCSGEVALDIHAVRYKMDSYAQTRRESQPREPSAGCIFKNPAGNGAGKLIDQCGLKGLSVGDAQVSPIHANFIVNRGSATASDIVNLVKRVRGEVFVQTGVMLEPEALLVGADWTEVLSQSPVAKMDSAVLDGEDNQ
jgi:UDP-N-acetylmuramate--alanine ligase